MKYFVDTEFIEGYKKPLLGKKIWTIDLISIGIVAEDGQEYYALNKEVDLKRVWKDKWLRENVLLGIYKEYVHGDRRNVEKFTYWTMKYIFRSMGKSRERIATDLRFFIFPSRETCKVEDFGEYVKLYGNPEIWGYFADYDWVVICSNLYGRMIDLPKSFPMYCLDLKQTMVTLGLSKDWKRENCPDPEGEHNALVDARWNKKLYEKIIEHNKNI